MDERTGGWTDGRMDGGARSARFGMDARMDGWNAGLAALAAEWTDGWTVAGARSARFGMDGRMDGWTVGLAPLASEWTDFFEFLGIASNFLKFL